MAARRIPGMHLDPAHASAARVRASSGTQTIPAQKPMLIVANHVTAFDVPLVLCGTARAHPAAHRGRDGRRPADGLAARARGAACMVRARSRRLLTGWSPRSSTSSHCRRARVFAAASRTRARRWTMACTSSFSRRAAAPPMERSRPFQSGIGLLARDSAAPVLPVAMVGLGEMKQRKRRWFRPGTVTIRVGRADHDGTRRIAAGVHRTARSARVTPDACSRRSQSVIYEQLSRLPWRSRSR